MRLTTGWTTASRTTSRRGLRSAVLAVGVSEGGWLGPPIYREDKAPMVPAGIYDSTDGSAIITTPSQGVVATLHDRMPVMLHTDTFAVWIDPSVKDVRSILATASADGLVCVPVSRDVNNVRNDNARVYHVPVVSSVPITPIDGLALWQRTRRTALRPTKATRPSRTDPVRGTAGRVIGARERSRSRSPGARASRAAGSL